MNKELLLITGISILFFSLIFIATCLRRYEDRKRIKKLRRRTNKIPETREQVSISTGKCECTHSSSFHEDDGSDYLGKCNSPYCSCTHFVKENLRKI